MSEIDRLLKELNDSVEKFNSSLSVIESNILAEVELLTHEITLSNGSIVQDVSNLQRVNKIKDAVDRVVISPEYQQRVIEFGKAYSRVEEIQNQYFAALIEEYTAPEVLGQVKNLAIENMVTSLTQTGIRANVSEKIGAIIQNGVETGAKYTDLTRELRNFIIGDAETLGALEKYASQITTDGLNQFAATYNKIVTDDLDMEWYTYVGALVKDSRDICEKLVEKKYVHKSELPQIVKGNIDGVQIPVSKTTGLPYGMIAGTNANNFQVRRGGYRCNHLLMPVSEERVPVEIRNRIKKKEKVEA